MSYVIDIFSLDTNEIIFDVNADSWLSHVGEHNNPPTPLHESSNDSNNNPTEINSRSYWRPSATLRKILTHLTNNEFAQFPCIPCSYCSRLLYPHSTKWIVKDETIRYPFELSYPEIPLTTHPNNSTKIAVCSGCKSNPDGRLSYKLGFGRLEQQNLRFKFETT